MTERTFDKLVRDRIPEIIREEGAIPKTRKVSGQEYTEYLHRKLKEEVQEFLNDPSIEELADVHEVLDSIADKMGHDEGDIIGKRMDKSSMNGSFNRQIVLESVRKE